MRVIYRIFTTQLAKARTCHGIIPPSTPYILPVLSSSPRYCRKYLVCDAHMCDYVRPHSPRPHHRARTEHERHPASSQGKLPPMEVNILRCIDIYLSSQMRPGCILYERVYRITGTTQL
ncbi:hypothetical protein K470DRAFT_67224 [Piedraia hortae CBS 480.64]|uniref:Uncharacterized protein n=1 Tax=Piedraia hortae CBS 480.64 TaxID=1314780 RepID=A0A6A7C0Q7_9PEZI|nr:hypothetical protein K470DRAFT_67224 [Piedraia hortae CBS 480.64]